MARAPTHRDVRKKPLSSAYGTVSSKPAKDPSAAIARAVCRAPPSRPPVRQCRRASEHRARRGHRLPLRRMPEGGGALPETGRDGRQENTPRGWCAKPDSKSALTGKSTEATISAICASVCAHENASPALVVARAWKPRWPRCRAVPASHGWGIAKQPRSWSLRNAARRAAKGESDILLLDTRPVLRHPNCVDGIKGLVPACR